MPAQRKPTKKAQFSRGCSLRRTILACFLLFSTAAFAQSNYAVVGGSVLDPQGHPFANATVQLTSTTTSTERHVNSSEQGTFQISAVLPGEYELKVEATGFATVTQKVQIEVGQQLTVQVKLKVASVKDT